MLSEALFVWPEMSYRPRSCIVNAWVEVTDNEAGSGFCLQQPSGSALMITPWWSETTLRRSRAVVGGVGDFFCEGKPHELEWIISGFLTPWQRQNNWSCCHRIHSAEDVRNQTAVWVIATSATFSFRWRAQRSRPVRRHYRMLLWHISIDAFDFKLKLSVRWSIMALHFRQSCSVMHCLPRSGPSRQRRLQEETLFIPL